MIRMGTQHPARASQTSIQNFLIYPCEMTKNFVFENVETSLTSTKKENHQR